MLCPLSAAYMVVALLTAAMPAAGRRHGPPAAPPDSTAEALILDEMRAFYRDLDDRNWTALVTHFVPAKVTARWVPPVASGAWARLAAPSPAPGRTVSASSDRCAPRAAVAIVGVWARVRVRRCAAPVDEAWLFRLTGHWKIVHLVLGTPPGL